MNGIISNGREPCSFSKVGKVVGELHVTAGTPRQNLAGLRVGQLLDRVRPQTAGHFDVACAQLHDATAVTRPTHHVIADTECIYDIKRKQRDVRCLQHVAAGVEYEIWRLTRLRHRDGFLTEPLQHLIIELQAGKHTHVLAHAAEILHALSAPIRQFILGLRNGDARHCK